MAEAKEYVRKYKMEVLFEGKLDAQYCLEGMRCLQMKPVTTITQNNELTVTNEWEGIIGRTLRIVCINCRLGMDYLGGCAIIGRSGNEMFIYNLQNNFWTITWILEDEVFVEKD
uniref:Uncharacterized protein n=1 Tax=Ditylenchus dipsaci TaxID=166011 RepID=A0A915DI21_9BILA